jgi:hypothetical protein
VLVAECALTVHISLVGLSEPDAKRALLDGLKPSSRPAQHRRFPGECKKPIAAAAPFPPNLARLHGVGVEEGATAIFPGMYVHEFVHDGRHLLGFPCH